MKSFRRSKCNREGALHPQMKRAELPAGSSRLLLTTQQDVPGAVVVCVAKQVGLAAEEFFAIPIAWPHHGLSPGSSPRPSWTSSRMPCARSATWSSPIGARQSCVGLVRRRVLSETPEPDDADQPADEDLWRRPDPPSIDGQCDRCGWRGKVYTGRYGGYRCAVGCSGAGCRAGSRVSVVDAWPSLCLVARTWVSSSSSSGTEKPVQGCSS